jgi:FMN phosphatase YigB (HAD superfamily)
MPVLLCNLASAFLGSHDDEPFRRALEPHDVGDLTGAGTKPPLCRRADSIIDPLELVDDEYRGFQTRRVGESEYARHLRSRLGWTGTDPQLVSLFTDHPYAVHLGALEVLRDLKSEGWTLIGLENADPWQERARRALYTDLALTPHRLITSLDVGARLPDPRMFAYARAQLGDPGDSPLFVDRDAVNVASARNAGLAAHLLRSAADLSAATRQFTDDLTG